MASATVSNLIRGQSLKSNFMPIGELALLILRRFKNFSDRNCSLLFKSATYWSDWGRLVEFAWQSFNFRQIMQIWKKIKLCMIWIGTKCDFRDQPWITIEVVTEAMFAQFDYNFQILWVWYFFSFGIFTKKSWGEPVHQKQLISSVWKLMNNPVYLWLQL